MKQLGSMIHSKGLKFGLYSDRGFRTCQEFPGLLDNEALDVSTMAGWGIDFLKNDGCYTSSPNNEGGLQPDPSASENYRRTMDAINASGRSIVHNVKGIPGGGCPIEDARQLSNLRRCGGDIGGDFGSAVGEFEGCQPNQWAAGYSSGHGFWNDPDSLEIGNGGQTIQEYAAHFSMWCVMKAPLILGFDLANPRSKDGTPKDIFNILLNKDMIAVNQDLLGIPATKARSITCAGSGGSTGRTDVYAGPLSGGGFVIMMLNPGQSGPGVDCNAMSVDLAATLNVTKGMQFTCKNLWTQVDCGPLTAGTNNFTVAKIPAASAVVVRLRPVSASVDTNIPPHELADEVRLRARAEMQAARYKAIRMRKERQALTMPPIDTPQHTASLRATAGAARAASAPAIAPTAPAPASAWPMRGRDSARSGTAAAKGPSICAIKWNSHNITHQGIDENTPVITAGGLVVVVLVAVPGHYGQQVASVMAVDLETGNGVWNASINGSSFGTPAALHTTTGTEYVVIGSSDGGIYAFAAATGVQLWRVQTGGPVFSSPVSTDAVAGTASVWVGSWDHMLYELDGDNGNVISTTDLGTQIRTAPAVVRVAVDKGSSSSSSSNGDGGGGGGGNSFRERVFTTVANGIVCVESFGKSSSSSNKDASPPPTITWQMNTTGFMYSSPTVSADGAAVFFGPSGDATVYALNASTGAVLWKQAALQSVMTSTKSGEGALSPGGKVLYVAGQDHSNCNTVILALSTKDGSSVWDANAQPWRGSTDSCDSPTALTVDGTGMVWVDNGKTLYGFDPASGNVAFNCTKSALRSSGYSGGVAIARDGLMIVAGDSGGITAVGA